MCVVYVHRRLDNSSVFYVGIGKSTRPYEKIGRNKHWHNIVNKTPYVIEIVQTNLNWEDAAKEEKRLISFYGRNDIKKGNLCNLTDGGDGAYGVVFTNERKLKISLAHKGKKFSKERCESMSIERKDFYKKNPSVRLRMSETSKKLFKDSEYVKKIKASLKIAMNKEDVKKKVGLASKKAWEVKGRKEKMSEMVTGRKHTKETRELMSIQRSGEKNPNFGRVFTEEQRLNMSKAQLGRVRIQTQEEKLKRSNTMKEKWARIKLEKTKLLN